MWAIIAAGVVWFLAVFWRERRSFSEANQGKYIYHTNGQGERIYHRYDCEYGRRVRFWSRRRASDQMYIFNRGYRPCKFCMPDRNSYKPDEFVPDVHDWLY